MLPENIAGVFGTIEAIRLFPGKALGALNVEMATVTTHGLSTPEGLRDRSFMIAVKNRRAAHSSDPAYLRFSQREQPELALVRPEWDGCTLTYTAPGMDTLHIHPGELLPRSEHPVRVEVIPGEIIPAVVENGPITARIRQFLSQFRDDVDAIDVLVTSTRHHRMVADKHRCGQHAATLFSDGGQQLLASDASLAFVNDRMRTKPRHKPLEGDVAMDAIRPNIQISGWPAHLEDVAASAKIIGARDGTYRDIEMLFGDLCIRCSVTMVNNETGKRRSDGEPLATFGEARPRRLDGNRTPTFGVNTAFNHHHWMTAFRTGDHIVAKTEKQVE